jgi:hypothetical protein
MGLFTLIFIIVANIYCMRLVTIAAHYYAAKNGLNALDYGMCVRVCGHTRPAVIAQAC